MIDADDSDSMQSPNFNEYDIGSSSDGRMYKKMMGGLGMSPGQQTTTLYPTTQMTTEDNEQAVYSEEQEARLRENYHGNYHGVHNSTSTM